MTNPKEFLEKTYADPQNIPWDNRKVPPELVDLVENKKIATGKALDIGCGTGNYSIFLAQNGFDVTAVDISENAIKIAKKKILDLNIDKIDFYILDARDISEIKGSFDFVLEWGLLHFIMPEFREAYITNLSEKIDKGGKYLTITFNEESPEWGGGKYRTGLSGAPLYYSSTTELEKLYLLYFKILEKKIRQTHFDNSGNTHLENYFLLEKR